jgi:hypothetical protein
LELIENEDCSEESDTVQGTWSIFQNKLVNIADQLVPEVTLVSNTMIRQKLSRQLLEKLIKRRDCCRDIKLQKVKNLENRLNALTKRSESISAQLKQEMSDEKLQHRLTMKSNENIM